MQLCTLITEINNLIQRETLCAKSNMTYFLLFVVLPDLRSCRWSLETEKLPHDVAAVL